ncbi:TIGR03943 family putative permease subunit [Antrihabitans cavernicola]|uniref:TIGR03943 family protein n=1 Tax=Antrihabitans cavernicola TaxID=2495913 RepID=A0A5A7S2Z3_9NOCA|nr:TIGR03943 family protein [Spelaeibacter cavernicola]KAA0018513.1 TIGR03943 family protein [Spelaeibacter cavernicola]
MNRETQNLLALLVGAAIVKIAVDGTYLRYVKPSMHVLLLISGIVIVVLALAAVVRDVRRGRADDDHDSKAGRPYWMLLIPALVILFVAPPALGASSVGTDRVIAGNQSSSNSAFGPLPPGDAPELPMLEVIERAAAGSGGGLAGRQITLAGFIVRTADGGKPRVDGSRDGYDLGRVVITCCAADARTMRVHLVGNLGSIADNTWLSIRGTVVPGSAQAATGFTPALTVSDLRRVPAPANTYAY